MHDEMDKISTAKVTSALELTENEKALLKEKLEKTSGHKMIIDYVIDESILGGFIVEADGKVMDASLKKHLKEIKDVIKR
jgi:F-type H+-transporting ATPase subunit delta